MILLMNKQAMASIVDQHEQDFRQVLQREHVTAEELFIEARGSSLLNEVLKAHEGLIGTLLGYGRDNAWLFSEKKHGKDISISSLWGTEIEEFMREKRTYTSLWFSDEGDDISKQLSYPCFMADPLSVETLLLKQQYLETRNNIIQYYDGSGEFLDATLALLTRKCDVQNAPDW